MDLITVYVSIGNSDDKLSQSEWAEYVVAVRQRVSMLAHRMHGDWYSAADAPWQNACWCIEVVDGKNVDHLRAGLARLAATYRQDSIAWAVAITEFLTPEVGR